VGVLKGRGNTLTLLRSERVEWELKKAGVAKEIQRLLVGKRSKESVSETDVDMDERGATQEETDGEQKRRDSFERGVSIEGEYAFVRAVGNF
jgi:hypothetical protein